MIIIFISNLNEYLCGELEKQINNACNQQWQIKFDKEMLIIFDFHILKYINERQRANYIKVIDQTDMLLAKKHQTISYYSFALKSTNKKEFAHPDTAPQQLLKDTEKQHSALYQTITQLKQLHNLNQPSKKQQRRLSESHKQRSMISNNQQLYSFQGPINRHFQGLKLTGLRQVRQKYKRSQNARSMIESKKMSSLRHLTQQQQVKSKMDKQVEKQAESKYNTDFEDLNLQEIISPIDDSYESSNLETYFQQSCRLYLTHLTAKIDLLSQSKKTAALKSAFDKCERILNEVGELSIRNLFLLAVIHFEFGNYSNVIMYMNKILNKTKGNLFALNLAINPKNIVPKSYNLNMIGYLYLAQSYKITNNFLSAISILSQCKDHLKSVLTNKKACRQGIQREQLRESGGKSIKRKPYITTMLQHEDTTSKMKRIFPHNSSIQLNKETIVKEHQKISERQKIKTRASLKQKLTSLIQFQLNCHLQITIFYLLFARVHLHVKNYQLAISYYRSSLAVNPNQIQAMVEMGCVYKIKEGNKRCLQWLQECLEIVCGETQNKDRLELDQAYLKYHKGLILLQEGIYDECYELFNEIKIRQLQSQVQFYKGFIKLQCLKTANFTKQQRTAQLEFTLMHFNQSISAYTSKTYIIKSYYYKLLILLFENKDYYGAQYQLNRFYKIVPLKPPSKSISIQTLEENEISKPSQQNSTDLENEFNLLAELIQGVVCILKMKILPGLALVKEVGVRVEGCSWVIKSLGIYYEEIIKLIYQFKFYCYYILRQYELSLKHCNKLKQMVQFAARDQSLQNKSRSNLTAQIKVIYINQLMLQCILLIKQSKYNYAISKLQQINYILNSSHKSQSSSNGHIVLQVQKYQQNISNGFILNNLFMLKALCYINLYSQLQESQTEGRQRNGAIQDSNKQILLSAEQLLRHCLITDKQNSLIYYLISTIHYQLNQYQSSLKYIREALQYSDDHMIKHYFAKANTKFMLTRYDEAIKDYTNAIIVFKEQIKSETKSQRQDHLKDTVKDEEYYSEKQEMIIQIYLNRAFAYIKSCYQFTNGADYVENYSLIANYKMKAGEDIIKFVQEVNSSNKIYSEKQISQALLLLMHTDDPAQIIELQKSLSPKYNILGQQQIIKIYYQIKQLNNCIQLLKEYLDQHHKAKQKVYEDQQSNHHTKQDRQAKQSLKHQKDRPLANAKLKDLNNDQHIKKLNVDLKCLQALKKSSRRQKGACQEALITLLQMTENIYRANQQEMRGQGQWQCESCGYFFKWSDILFFIGVIHFELEQYETAIKYFEQSYNQKKTSGTLYSLSKFTVPIIKRFSSEEGSQTSFLFQDLESIFENRVYSKEELQYNIGLCYLMLSKYKQAYYYLQDYPKFIDIIKKAITNQQTSMQNEFVEMTHIDERMGLSGNQKMAQKIDFSKSDIEGDIKSYSQSELSDQKEDQFYDNLQNITPFPTHNRLCSIYPPNVITTHKFYLSFCLPKLQLPLLRLFTQEEIEPAELCQDQADYDQSGRSSQASHPHRSLGDHPIINLACEKGAISSAIKHISLNDLQMKPIAPWIRQNSTGVIFTQNLMGYSIQLNSQRQSRRRDRQEIKEQKRIGNDRYGQYQFKK